MIAVNVVVERSFIGTTNVCGLFRSIAPKIHWPRVIRPRLYFRRPILASSASTITSGPPNSSLSFSNH